MFTYCIINNIVNLIDYEFYRIRKTILLVMSQNVHHPEKKASNTSREF